MSSAGTAYVDVEAKLDGFASDIDAAVSAVDAQVDVTANVDEAQGDIDSLNAEPIDVQVGAEVAEAQGEIDSLEGSPVDIPVSADTEAAQQSIDDLSGSMSALGDAAQGALGGMGGLDGAAAGLTGSLGASALAGAGAAAGIFEFAQAAIDAESASQRFDLIAGDLADQVGSIDVGGLSGDIGDLALQLGSSDEAMLNATASFVTFAESTGASDQQIVAASDNINALALRAVALNPALGDAGEVATRLTNALARGGRATTQFGIGIQSAEINARAMADTGKQNADELTQFEKAAAGAEIAVERLGNTMGTDFQQGSQNARTEWNRMTESLGEAAETAGGVMLPAIENITEAVTELGSGVANLSPRDWLSGLWDLSGGLIANGFTDLWGAVGLGEDTLRGVGTLVGELPPALGGTADAADEAAQAFSDLSAEMDDYLNAVVNIPASQRDVQQSITDLTATLADNESSWFDIADAQDDVVVSTADLIQQMADHGASQEELDGVIANTIGMLRSERDQGRITAQQFSDLAGEIRGIPNKATTVTTAPGLSQVYGTATNYRAMMDRIDGDTVSSTFIANGLNRIYMDSVNYRAIMNDLDGRVVTTYTKNIALSPLPKYAGGTESAMAGLAVVGEEGPELVVFGGGERVIPAGQTQSMLAGVGDAPSGGASIVVNVHGSATAADGQAVVDALRRWSQHNGPVPVKVSA